MFPINSGMDAMMRRIKKIDGNVKIAFGIFVVVGLWLASGVITFAAAPQKKTVVAATSFAAEHVATSISVAERYMPSIEVSGFITSKNSVVVKSQVAGIVRRIFVKSGSYVQKGKVLARLSGGDGGAKLRQAAAAEKAAHHTFLVNKKLYARGFLTIVGFQSAKASYDAAKSALELARQRQSMYAVKAPFSGRVGVVRVSKGQTLNPTSEILDLSGTSNDIFTGYISSNWAKRIHVGDTFSGRTVDGSVLRGAISGISSVPEQQIPVYRIQGALTSDTGVNSGEAASVSIALRPQKAHKIAASFLTIDDAGDLGVKILEKGIVAFKHVAILNENLRQLWVSGLPNKVILLTYGAGFVKVGQHLPR